MVVPMNLNNRPQVQMMARQVATMTMRVSQADLSTTKPPPISSIHYSLYSIRLILIKPYPTIAIEPCIRCAV